MTGQKDLILFKWYKERIRIQLARTKTFYCWKTVKKGRQLTQLQLPLNQWNGSNHGNITHVLDIGLCKSEHWDFVAPVSQPNSYAVFNLRIQDDRVVLGPNMILPLQWSKPRSSWWSKSTILQKLQVLTLALYPLVWYSVLIISANLPTGISECRPPPRWQTCPNWLSTPNTCINAIFRLPVWGINAAAYSHGLLPTMWLVSSC